VALATATLDVTKLSAKYRNWTYVDGQYDGFVVPPTAGNFSGQTVTDAPVVWEKTAEDTVAGDYRLGYLFYHNIKGAYGYETGMAHSADLIHWSFGEGGDKGLVFHRNPVKGTYDYGGVTLGGMHYTSNHLEAPRTLQKSPNGKYHALYGCYPNRQGYETGNGGEGVAESADGVTWSRVSQTVPILSGGSLALAPWESQEVYQPFLVVDNGTCYDFYNARGINEYHVAAEESGIANVALSDFPGIKDGESLWTHNKASPVIPSGAPGSDDNKMASDPKVYWDAEQGVWIMLYFGLGDATEGHAEIEIAFSTDLVKWEKDPIPLYKAGGHPAGIDKTHAHKVALIYKDGVGYMFYCAVGPKGRGIALLTSKPVAVAHV